MNEIAPCKGCTDRQTACHATCERYKQWRDRYHAQQKHLDTIKGSWNVPWSASRDKLAKKHSKFGADCFKHGGKQ